MTNRGGESSTTSSDREGRCAISTGCPFHGRPPYDAVVRWCAGERRRSAAPRVVRLAAFGAVVRVVRWCVRCGGAFGAVVRAVLLLAVELDDQLLLDLGVDDRPGRQGV